MMWYTKAEVNSVRKGAPEPFRWKWRIAEDCLKLIAENERLRTIVDKYQTTDGLSIMECEAPVYRVDDTIVPITGWHVWSDGFWTVEVKHDVGTVMMTCTDGRVFSSLATAQAAEKGNDDG